MSEAPVEYTDAQIIFTSSKVNQSSGVGVIDGDSIEGVPVDLQHRWIAVDIEQNVAISNRTYVVMRKDKFHFVRGSNVKGMDYIVGRMVHGMRKNLLQGNSIPLHKSSSLHAS